MVHGADFGRSSAWYHVQKVLEETGQTPSRGATSNILVVTTVQLHQLNTFYKTHLTLARTQGVILQR